MVYKGNRPQYDEMEKQSMSKYNGPGFTMPVDLIQGPQYFVDLFHNINC